MKNKNLKRILALTGAVAVVSASLLGCSSPEPEKTEEVAAEEEDKGGKNVVWAGWSGEEEASKEIWGRMIDTYETESGNTVDWIGSTWADNAQQILIRSQGGEQLDIAQVDIAMFNTLAQAGLLADVSEVVGQDYLDATFETAALEAGQLDGKQLAIPWSMASISMVYNPEILAAAGWEKPPVTMDEFEKCLADIKAYDPNIIPYGVSTKDATAAGDFMPWLWTFGGLIYDEEGNVTVNEQAAIDTIKWYQDMLSKGYIAMDTGRGEARQMFAQKQVAFYDDAVVAKGQAVSNGVAPEDVSKVCAAMPRPVLKEGDKPQSTHWGHMLVIFENSENKEAAADLAKSLVSEETAMDYFTNNGMPPVHKDVLAKPEIAEDAFIAGFIESTKTAKLEETAAMVNAGEIKSIITEEMQAALLGNKSAEDAAATMEERLNAL